jgi:peptide/nickel transport system substrate-binding protein
MVLHRRRDYWRRGADGDPLPYLDDLIYLELRPEDRVAAMQGGLIDTLVMPRPADWEALRYAPGLQVLNTRTAQALVLRMRVDREPWTDVRVRNALKLCQNRAQILHVSFHDQGELAIDAHVAPVHHAYCKQPIPPYDPALSRAMLAEAGYPDGLDVTLTTKNDQGEREMARVLQELAEPGGFRIHLNIVNPTRYWTQWTDVDLGITQWFHRPLPTMLLSLAYTASEDGTLNPWNETHWVDEEFTRLLSQAERTADLEEQRALMCRLETIMQERGPIGISYWSYAWNIIRADFQNVRAHPNGYDLFYDVWKGTA